VLIQSSRPLRLITAIGFEKVDPFKPHDCRRTYATNLLKGDIDVFIVQSLMGHSDSSTTARYDMRGDVERGEACDGVDLFPY